MSFYVSPKLLWTGPNRQETWSLVPKGISDSGTPPPRSLPSSLECSPVRSPFSRSAAPSPRRGSSEPAASVTALPSSPTSPPSPSPPPTPATPSSASRLPAPSSASRKRKRIVVVATTSDEEEDEEEDERPAGQKEKPVEEQPAVAGRSLRTRDQNALRRLSLFAALDHAEEKRRRKKRVELSGAKDTGVENSASGEEEE